METTPLDIQHQQFRVRFRGFDIREVDTFLEKTAEAFESLHRKNKNLYDEIRRLKNVISDHKEREETFKRTLVSSQKILDQMKENAQKSAELIIANAEVRAEKMLNKAHNRLAQLHEDIAELKRQRIQIEVQIRSIIETHSKLLEIGQEEIKAMDEEDSKLKLLTHPK